MKTELELEKWMVDNCYSMESYSINGSFISEGYGIEKNENIFQWYFTERGQKKI